MSHCKEIQCRSRDQILAKALRPYEVFVPRQFCRCFTWNGYHAASFTSAK